jgi:hypothetical protein
VPIEVDGLGRPRYLVSVSDHVIDPQTPSHENMGKMARLSIRGKHRSTYPRTQELRNTMPGVVKFMCTIRVFFPHIFQPFGVPSATMPTSMQSACMLAFSASRTPRQRHEGARKGQRYRKKKQEIKLRRPGQEQVSTTNKRLYNAAFGLSRSCGWRGTVG